MRFRSGPIDPNQTRYALMFKNISSVKFTSDQIEAQGYEVVVLGVALWNSLTLSKPGAKDAYLRSKFGMDSTEGQHRLDGN